MQLAGNRSLGGCPAHFRAPSVGCLRCSRHETCPSTTFYPDLSTIPRIPRKPQAVYLRFSFRPYRRGRWMAPKRSRWAGFVAGGPRGAVEWAPSRRTAAARAAPEAAGGPKQLGRRPRRRPRGAPRGPFRAIRARSGAPAPRPRKFFQKCPCTAVRVPV